MTIEKALLILADAYDEKQRERGVEALSELSVAIKEAEHDKQDLRDALGEITSYDSTWTGVSIGEGIRRLRERITEQNKETQLLRALYERSDGVLTAAKVALMGDLTADHRWHPPEENCPHVRCIALNKIEDLRSG